jgi:hypothetical protein
MNEDEEDGYTYLSQLINLTYTRVAAELSNGRKTSHWMWYYFPTEKPGASDPYQTYINEVNAIDLLKNQKFIKIHKKILKLINSGHQIETIFPPIDWGRIKFFVKFWKNIKNGFSEIKGLEDYLEILEENEPNC